MMNLHYTIDRALFEERRVQAAAAGFDIAGDAGKDIKVDNVVFDFNYVEPDLNIVVEHDPIMSNSFVRAKFDKYFGTKNPQAE